MSLKTMVRNDLRKLLKRHSERPGDLMKNLETPGETGRVGRYMYGPGTNFVSNLSQYLKCKGTKLRVYKMVDAVHRKRTC